MGRITELSGLGTSGGSPQPPAPNPLTLSAPVIRFTLPDNQGKVYVEAFFPYTPPSPVGTFAGVLPYLQAPDNIPASASGNAATIGDFGFVIAQDFAHAADAGSVVPVQQPIPLTKIPYDPANLIIAIRWPAPATAETWRLYALAYSPDITPDLVTADKPFPTPNITFLVDPGAPAQFGGSGAEYAPLALSFTSPAGASVLTPGDGLTYNVDSQGNQTFTVQGVWINHDTDPRFPLLGSYNIVLDWPDGSRHNDASPDPAALQWTSDGTWTLSDTPQTFTMYLVSVDVTGNANSIVPGLTPSVTFTVQRQVSTAGQEYTSLVTDLTATTPGFTFASSRPHRNADGQRDFPVIGRFTEPDDPSFASVIWHFIYPAVAISAVTNQVGTVFTFPAGHGIPVGGDVDIEGFTGNWLAANGSWPATVFDSTHLSIPVDSTLFGALSGSPTGALDITLTGPATSPTQLDVFSFPTANENVTLYAVSMATDGSVNTYVQGVTPSTVVTLFPPPIIGTGIEYTPLVTGFTASIVYKVSGDGVETWGFTAAWTNPDPLINPEFAGAKLVLRNTGGGQPDIPFYAGVNDTSMLSPQWPIGATATYDLFAVSVDVNGRENSIAGGTTPEQTLTPSLQTAGSMKANRLDSATLESRLTKVSGKLDIAANSLLLGKFDSSVRPIVIVSSLPALPDATNYPAGTIVYNTTTSSLARVKPGGLIWDNAIAGPDIVANSIIAAHIVAGQIDTTKLTTSEISIGSNGASMPIRFRVYNHAGSAIAWIGDDTANSGYVGGWFQQLYVGGSGPSGAPFQVDASGKLSISLTSANVGAVALSLNLNNVVTTIANGFDSGAVAYQGLQITYTPTGSYAGLGYFTGVSQPGLYLKNATGRLIAVSADQVVSNNDSNNLAWSIQAGILKLADSSGAGSLDGHGTRILLNGASGDIQATSLHILGKLGLTTNLTGVLIGGVSATLYFSGGILWDVTYP